MLRLTRRRYPELRLLPRHGAWSAPGRNHGRLGSSPSAVSAADAIVTRLGAEMASARCRSVCSVRQLCLTRRVRAHHKSDRYPQATLSGSTSDREFALLGRRGHSLCLSFATLGRLVSQTVQFRLHILEWTPQSPKAGERSGVFMRESNTLTFKLKKIQTATMKRRSLKAKSIEAAPTKARSPQVRAVVVTPTQPPGL
jgi:hypothetical protein